MCLDNFKALFQNLPVDFIFFLKCRSGSRILIWTSKDIMIFPKFHRGYFIGYKKPSSSKGAYRFWLKKDPNLWYIGIPKSTSCKHWGIFIGSQFVGFIIHELEDGSLNSSQLADVLSFSLRNFWWCEHEKPCHSGASNVALWIVFFIGENQGIQVGPPSSYK